MLEREQSASEFALVSAHFHHGWDHRDFHTERFDRPALRFVSRINHECSREVGVQFCYTLRGCFVPKLREHFVTRPLQRFAADDRTHCADTFASRTQRVADPRDRENWSDT